jgi:hypothetical protein
MFTSGWNIIWICYYVNSCGKLLMVHILSLFCHYCDVRFNKQTITAIAYLHDKWLCFNMHSVKMFLLCSSIVLYSHCNHRESNKQTIPSARSWCDKCMYFNIHPMEMMAQSELCWFLLQKGIWFCLNP